MNKQFRSLVWETTLGVRAKLTLIALSDLSIINGKNLTCPANIFVLLVPMIGRRLSQVVHSIRRLESQKILAVVPTETGYFIEFFPENEIRNQSQKRGA